MKAPPRKVVVRRVPFTNGNGSTAMVALREVRRIVRMHGLEKTTAGAEVLEAVRVGLAPRRRTAKERRAAEVQHDIDHMSMTDD